MLSGLRQTANQGLTIVIFGTIIVVFALNFGPGSVAECGGKIPVAATVNGRRISEAEFARRYAAVFANMAQYRPGYTVDQAKAENLKSKVLEEMVGEELLAQEAERRGLAVSAEELRDEIKKIPAFQTDGKFDRQKYSQYARYSNLSEAKFEEDFSRQLLTQKMRRALEDLASVSPAEVREQWENRNNRADLEYVKVDPAFFRKQASAKATPDAVKALLTADKKAVEDYYAANSTRFSEPRRVRARHILAKVAEGAPEAEVQKAREKIEAAKKRVDGGEDFAKVAKEVSEDSSAPSGGDLGMQGPGAWVKPFEDAVNLLRVGDVSPVVRTRFGFHVIKAEEVKEASKKELVEVEEEIAKTLLEDKVVKAEAQAVVDKVLVGAREGKALEDVLPKPAEGVAADPLAPKAEVTGWFSKGTKYVPRLGVAPEIVTAAFATDKPGLLDQVFTVSDRLHVVKVRERELPDPAKFEEEKTSIEEQMVGMKRSRVVADFIKERRTERTAARSIQINPDVVSYDVSSQASAPNPLNDF
jgi:peptidyl-prolyl cis-trans isomerase D